MLRYYEIVGLYSTKHMSLRLFMNCYLFYTACVIGEKEAIFPCTVLWEQTFHYIISNVEPRMIRTCKVSDYFLQSLSLSLA